MIIRPADTNDTVSIVTLGKKLLLMHYTIDKQYYELEPDFDELFRRWVVEQINSHYQFLFVCVDESVPQQPIRGFISGFIKSLYPWFTLKAVGHVSYLYVEEEYRKKGLAKKLEAEALKWFQMKKLPFAELYVEESNLIGQKTWTSLGYLPFKKFLRKRI